jgi:hypothetical protein
MAPTPTATAPMMDASTSNLGSCSTKESGCCPPPSSPWILGSRSTRWPPCCPQSPSREADDAAAGAATSSARSGLCATRRTEATLKFLRARRPSLHRYSTVMQPLARGSTTTAFVQALSPREKTRTASPTLGSPIAPLCIGKETTDRLGQARHHKQCCTTAEFQNPCMFSSRAASISGGPHRPNHRPPALRQCLCTRPQRQVAGGETYPGTDTHTHA